MIAWCINDMHILYAYMIRSNIFFYNFYKRYHTKVKKLKLYYAREVCKIIMITPIYYDI